MLEWPFFVIINIYENFPFRLCKFLGCPHSCGEAHRCRSTSELLRLQILNTFNKLYEIDQRQFRMFLRDIINQRPLTEVIDFFHSFVGFCSESGSPISPLRKYFVKVELPYLLMFNVHPFLISEHIF